MVRVNTAIFTTCCMVVLAISAGYASNSQQTLYGEGKGSMSMSENHIFQVATIGSLARGVYDGDFTYGDLFQKGTLGLGTFEGIDGEMVAVDSVFYQIDAKGTLRKVQPDEIVPFAEVINFKAKHTESMQSIANYDALMSQLSSGFNNKNIPHAIRIDGTFSHLKLRSLRKQKKPYTSLAVAAKNQAIFELDNVKGTVVGFWFPAYWGGIAVPGFHLHFVSDARDIGGHILDIAIDNAVTQTASSNDFSIHMPSTDSFAAANLDPQALHNEIKAAEGGVE